MSSKDRTGSGAFFSCLSFSSKRMLSNDGTDAGGPLVLTRLYGLDGVLGAEDPQAFVVFQALEPVVTESLRTIGVPVAAERLLFDDGLRLPLTTTKSGSTSSSAMALSLTSSVLPIASCCEYNTFDKERGFSAAPGTVVLISSILLAEDRLLRSLTLVFDGVVGSSKIGLATSHSNG
ncbi:hypothetical protein OGAPHI_005521 [Ogataea philodendri]|uniref:Uncharacterized protein n=1 Tax=Ogataea philodendri TaxID=1378263 RepID=A0A9P8NZB7_9ASCO|nr:uncharacterized protein OGAPHI_005521 [Ogataea philodendri]KAH3662272.1 hypothetical protein OGAPHI_005521 [Ogataea philodendri]